MRTADPGGVRLHHADAGAGAPVVFAHALGTDHWTPTAGLALPSLAIAGSEDGSPPPDLVRETAALVTGSRFHLIRGAGHLPCIEAPEAFAVVPASFLSDIGSDTGLV